MQRRLIIWTSVCFALALAGIGGYVGYRSWWQNRPDQVFAAARAHYARGEEALKREDVETARQAFEAADERLQILAPTEKTPERPEALLLRYRTLTHLASLTLNAEKAGRASPPGRTANDLARKARPYAYQAATDVTNTEAQAAMLEVCFREDQLDLAERYARNLLEHLPASPDVSLHPHIMGAHFVMARMALRRVPTQPDAVLRHVREADEAQQRWTAKQANDSRSRPDPRTRWRMINLDAQALLLNTGSTRPTGVESPPASRAEEQAQEAFRSAVSGWLDRLRKDAALAAAERSATEPTGFTGMSGSDVRGMLEFLTLAVEQAPDQPQTLERLRLTLDVWAALIDGAQRTPPGKNATPAGKEVGPAMKEVAQSFNRWPQLMEKVPHEFALQPRDWQSLYPAFERVGSRLMDAKADVGVEVFAGLARNAQTNGQWESGCRFAALGLKAAAARHLPPDNLYVLDLHSAAAWMNLLQNKSQEVDEHLEVLREIPNYSLGLAGLIDTVRTLEDGALERSATQLQRMRQHPEFGRSVYFFLASAHVELALGRFDRALSHLEKLDRFIAKTERLPEEQQALANRLSLHRAGMALELFRCHLALGNMEQAMLYKGQIAGTKEGLTASLLLARHYLGYGPTASFRRTPTSRPASTEDQAAARRELDFARQMAHNDPRVLLVEAELLAAPATPAALSRAEEFLRTTAATADSRGDDARIVWASWLLRRNRTGEAGEVLDRLDRNADESVRRRVKNLRDLWQLTQSRLLAESNRMITFLGLAEEGGSLDIYFVNRDGYLSGHETAGLKLFWRGQSAAARDEVEAAARAYARAMSFTFLRAPARRHLLACLLRLREKGQPALANALASEFLQAQSVLARSGPPTDMAVIPYDPVVLVAFIETALPLDNVRGEQGIEGALKALEATLATGQTRDPAAASSYQARIWLAAGRADRAQIALRKAFELVPGHLPSLQIAVPIARANEDWKACLQYADALEKAEPENVETALWRAEALAHQGDTKRAQELYQQFIEKYANRSEGYLGLVGLLEGADDLTSALAQVSRWRSRVPSDYRGLQTEVRLLIRTGKLDAAIEAADRGVREGPRPTAEREAVAALFAARGFLEASRPAEALTYARRAETAAAQTANLVALNEVRCFLGDVCRELARTSRDTPQRTAHLDEAVKYYRAVLEKAPRHPDAGRKLALLGAEERGGLDAAYDLVQELRRSRYGETLVGGDRLPTDLLDVVGTVYVASGHSQEAVALFREAAESRPRDPLVYYHLGRALAALGQRSDAADNLTRAVALAEDRAAHATQAGEKARWLGFAAAARKAER